jgi:hypothetical protein
MIQKISRRQVIKGALLASAFHTAIGLSASNSQPTDLTPLDPDDATARSVGFVTDASRVVPAENPAYKAGSRCELCLQFQGRPGAKAGGCSIFSGHSVPATGWCQAWTARST